MDRKWWTLVAVCTGVFMLLLDVTIVNVALPDIQKSLGANLSQLQWVVDAYALSLAALLLTAGSIADRFGRRAMFAVGIVVFTAGSLLCGVAGDPTFLALARAFQGVGGAIMFATSLALLSTAFQGRERGTAFGVFGAVTGVAVAVGPGARRRDHQRPVMALDLLRQHPGRRLRPGRDAPARAGVARPAGAARRLRRLRHVQPRTRGARVRADPQQRGRLGLDDRRRVAGRRRGAAGRLRGGRVRPARADVRPLAGARPDVRRRARLRVRHLGFAVRAADLHRAVHPERARLLGDRGRRAVPRR